LYGVLSPVTKCRSTQTGKALPFLADAGVRIKAGHRYETHFAFAQVIADIAKQFAGSHGAKACNVGDIFRVNDYPAWNDTHKYRF
jgi:hypothetical protein